MRSGWLRRKHHVVQSQLIDQSVCRDGRGCRIGLRRTAVRVDVQVLGITKLSSLALGLATRPLFGLPPPQSPPISTLPPPARPDASRRALASLMSSPVTRIVPPCVPFFLPAAASVPETLTVWVAAPAGLLAPVAALSTIMPLC